MFSLSGSTKPTVGANPDAVEEVQSVTTIRLGDRQVSYEGAALRWDTSKTPTISLVFRGPWYAKREIRATLWSEVAMRLQVSSSALGARYDLDVGGRVIPAARSLSIAVPSQPGDLAGEVRLYLTVLQPPGGFLHIGIDGRDAHEGTSMAWRVVPNLPLAVLTATWAIIFSILFAVGLQTGTKGGLYALPAMALVPVVLKLLGVKWAESFDVSRLALWIANHRRRGLAKVWALLGLPAGIFMLYVAAALTVFGSYYYRLQSAGLDDHGHLEDLAALFCAYPERIEVRALLARRIHAINASAARANAYEEVTRQLPVSRFLSECLSPRRFTPLFQDVVPARRDDARIFYASLWWNSISKDEHFDVAMVAIREVLAHSTLAHGLAALTLAKYELRSVKNQNEQTHCTGPKLASDDCLARKRQCAEMRDALVRLLDQRWTPSELKTVTYLEARDVAASSFMSAGCLSQDAADPDHAVSHLWALVRAIPRQEVVLDDFLTQINFRKFLDSQFEQRPEHKTSVGWKQECQTTHATVCKLLHETFINDLKQTFFTPNREQRAVEWDSPCIPALQGAAMERRMEELSTKGWKWPL